MQSNQIQNKKAVLVGVEFLENRDFALDMEELSAFVRPCPLNAAPASAKA